MGKKIVSTIIVTIFIAYFSFALASILKAPLLFGFNIETFFVVLAAFVVGFLIISLIYTLVERFNEIDREDKDDLSKY
ncbi:hypothetical protein IMX26_00795 [Clostridium sp. 'deep sea']|uniref:hypothetical protein n=1 Tax=Clostridium sp. 'deep sea' TaxID=2779445 RepID=UPI00189667DC|nr:hypothetical protein [Clostridium sp. 'deep sea']QOR35413.1 hypothetical protein IMX26_00795 [Clostridium sp. 'deep sea']